MSSVALALTNITSWLFIASLKTIPLIAFILLSQKLFRKFLSASAKYLLWFSVLISLSLPFGWGLHITPLSTQASPIYFMYEKDVASINVNQAPVMYQEAAPAIAAQSAIINSTNIDIWLTYVKKYFHVLLSVLWFCGALFFLSLTLFKAHYFNQLKRKAIEPIDELFQLFNVCKREMGVNTTVQLLMSADIQSPITLGWINPSVVLPKNITQQLTNETIKHVLLHELGHIKRQDIFFNWLSCLINILHWFNPMVWLACRRMRMDMEMACDALVLSHLEQSQRKHYGATLINVSGILRISPRALTNVGILENHIELRERLNTIKEFTTMNIKNTIFFGVILTATAVTSLAQPEQSTIEVSAKSNVISESTREKSIEATITLRDFAARAEKDLKTKILVGNDYADKKIQANLNRDTLHYGQLLTQLKINGYTAYKSKDYIQIIDIRQARDLSIPVVEKGITYEEDEMVTDYLKTEKVCSGNAMIALRPLVPLYGHMSAIDDSRTLIVIDTYGNIQRIRSAISALEATMDAPEYCGSPKNS